MPMPTQTQTPSCADHYRKFVGLGRHAKDTPLCPLLYCPPNYSHDHRAPPDISLGRSQAVFWWTENGYEPGYALIDDFDARDPSPELIAKSRELVLDFEAGKLVPPKSVLEIICESANQDSKPKTPEQSIDQRFTQERKDVTYKTWNRRKPPKVVRVGDRWACNITGCNHAGLFLHGASAYRHIREKHGPSDDSQVKKRTADETDDQRAKKLCRKGVKVGQANEQSEGGRRAIITRRKPQELLPRPEHKEDLPMSQLADGEAGPALSNPN